MNKQVELLEETIRTVDAIGIESTISGLKMIRYNYAFHKKIEPLIVNAMYEVFDITAKDIFIDRNKRVNDPLMVSIYCFLMQKYTNVPLSIISTKIKRSISQISRYIYRITEIKRSKLESLKLIQEKLEKTDKIIKQKVITNNYDTEN